MPTLQEIQELRKKKTFKKRDFRPWNIDGEEKPVIDDNTDIEVQADSPEVSSPALPEETRNLSENLLEIDPNEIFNWSFHDRPENELGDIESLAAEFKKIGQQQPCIVRLSSENPEKPYELIVGERRWRAAMKAEIPLKVIVKNLTDSQAAIIQASENSSRKDLSDYAKGMSYHKLIQNEILTQKELISQLNISPQKLSRMLSFSKIPLNISKAITTWSKISARTAEEIVQLSRKGPEYIDIILEFVDNLQSGKLGHNKLREYVEKRINKPKNSRKHNEKVFSRNGRHLFTWREDNNMQPSIHFPNDISQLIKMNKLNTDDITQRLVKSIEEMLMEVN